MLLKLFILLRLGLAILTFVLVVRFFPQPDFELYSSSEVPFEADVSGIFDRTFLTASLFTYVSWALGGSVFLANTFFLVIEHILLYAFLKKTLNFPSSNNSWLLLLGPSLLTWSSVYSKEMLFFIVLLALMLCVLSSKRYLWRFSFILLLVGLIAILRIQFLVSIAFLYIILTFRNQYARLGTIIAGAVTLIFFVISLPHDFLLKIMDSIYMYFFYFEGNTNRYWIEWDSVDDIVKALPVGYYTSVFKFLPSELLIVKSGILFWIEGAFFLFYCILVIRLFKAIDVISILILICVVFSVNLPLNIFNPGSAIRYSVVSFEFFILSLPVIYQTRSSILFKLKDEGV